MCSGAHVTQIDSHPSPVGAFLEGALLCKPQPPVRSCVLQVLSLLPPCPLSPLPLRSVRTFLSFALLTPVAKVGVPLSRTLSTALMHTHEAGDACAQNDKKGGSAEPKEPPLIRHCYPLSPSSTYVTYLFFTSLPSLSSSSVTSIYPRHTTTGTEVLSY